MVFLYILVDRIHIIESDILANFPSFFHFKKKENFTEAAGAFPG